MTKNSTGLRPWTATEIRKLRGLAKKKMDIRKIARVLNRSAAATAAKAQTLGLEVDVQDGKPALETQE
jgi:hypothetical protein